MKFITPAAQSCRRSSSPFYLTVLLVTEFVSKVKPMAFVAGLKAPRVTGHTGTVTRSGDAEPLAAVRIIERQLADLDRLGTVILCEEVDPTLLLGQETRTRFLAYPDAGEAWPATLDALLA